MEAENLADTDLGLSMDINPDSGKDEEITLVKVWRVYREILLRALLSSICVAALLVGFFLPAHVIDYAKLYDEAHVNATEAEKQGSPWNMIAGSFVDADSDAFGTPYQRAQFSYRTALYTVTSVANYSSMMLGLFIAFDAYVAPPVIKRIGLPWMLFQTFFLGGFAFLNIFRLGIMSFVFMLQYQFMVLRAVRQTDYEKTRPFDPLQATKEEMSERARDKELIYDGTPQALFLGMYIYLSGSLLFIAAMWWALITPSPWLRILLRVIVLPPLMSAITQLNGLMFSGMSIYNMRRRFTQNSSFMCVVITISRYLAAATTSLTEIIVMTVLTSFVELAYRVLFIKYAKMMTALDYWLLKMRVVVARWLWTRVMSSQNGPDFDDVVDLENYDLHSTRMSTVLANKQTGLSMNDMNISVDESGGENSNRQDIGDALELSFSSTAEISPSPSLDEIDVSFDSRSIASSSTRIDLERYSTDGPHLCSFDDERLCCCIPSAFLESGCCSCCRFRFCGLCSQDDELSKSSANDVEMTLPSKRIGQNARRSEKMGDSNVSAAKARRRAAKRRKLDYKRQRRAIVIELEMYSELRMLLLCPFALYMLYPVRGEVFLEPPNDPWFVFFSTLVQLVGAVVTDLISVVFEMRSLKIPFVVQRNRYTIQQLLFDVATPFTCLLLAITLFWKF